MLLVVLTSLVLLFFSFLSNYGNRVTRSKLLKLLSTFSITGYAIPGVILAVAFITFIAWFDNTVIKYFELASIKKIIYWVHFRISNCLLCKILFFVI